MSTPTVKPPTASVLMTQIIIERLEGPADDCKTLIFASYQKANEYLKSVCLSKPPNNLYDKCNFTVCFQDGEEYKGRFDAGNPHCRNHEVPDIGAHARAYLEFTAGLRKPDHMSDEEYEESRKRRLEKIPDIEAEALRFLKSYSLVDVPTEAAPAPAPTPPADTSATNMVDIATQIVLQSVSRIVQLLVDDITAAKTAGRPYAPQVKRMMDVRRALHSLNESMKP